MTSNKLLPKGELDCTYLPSLKSYITLTFPQLFGEVSQSYLKFSLLGYSPDFDPNKI